MKRLVVIGGGISGTAAAWTAKKRSEAAGVKLDVVLLEREGEIGGKAASVSEGDWLFETGPIGYLDNEPVVDELARSAGLGSEIIRAGDAQSHRFVYVRGRVREVATNPLRFLSSGVLSLPGILRLAAEPFVARKRGEEDESVWGFGARRLGPEFADRLLHPMVLGIFAGDAKKLSLPSCFPIMAELERKHGSLFRAQFQRARARRRGELPPRRSATLSSFPRGIQTLPSTLAERGEFDVRTNKAVKSLARRNDDSWSLAIEGEHQSVTTDAVIVACEGWAAASLLTSAAPEVAARLDEISYPPIYVAALGYGPEARRAVPPGFGVLIPRNAGYRALGVTWDGHLFPGRNPKDGLLVRLLFGGSFDPEVGAVGPEQILATSEKEMRELFGLEVEPIYRSVRLWPRAIPQYELGHADRLAGIEEKLARVPGLYLAGNALYGPAFGKAAARGVACGNEAFEFLFGVE